MNQKIKIAIELHKSWIAACRKEVSGKTRLDADHPATIADKQFQSQIKKMTRKERDEFYEKVTKICMVP